MKSLLVTSIAAIVLVGTIQAQSCGPYWKHMKCTEGDEPCCSAYGQCGASQLHCKWTGRYQNTNQTAGSCIYTPCSSKTDCCDQNTGNCMWNPDGKSDEHNFCKEGVNYNKMEYDLHPKKTMPPATTSASTAKPTSAATEKPTTSPKPTTTATMKPTKKPTTTPTKTPKPTSNATVAPTSQATTKPTTKPTKSPKPTSNATATPTTSPKPTSNVTQKPTSQATHKPTKNPCTPECPVEHCHDGYCHVPTMQPTSQHTTPPPTSNATASPCKHPPCSSKSCHNNECYEYDDGYNGAALANSGVAFALAVIYLAATFVI